MSDHHSPATDPVAIVHTVAELRRTVSGWRSQNLSVALVPTIGALHAGHLSLINYARQRCDCTVVSIFVNPTQFAAGEDLARYPRPLDSDLAQLAGCHTDLAYVPGVGEMYPAGIAPGSFGTRISVPDLTADLEGSHRHGHFDGVATVVGKLLLQCLPDIAVFGEKDYQQLQVVTRMVTDLCIPLTIEGAPTVRESDGLAMSSRNVYLNAQQRRIAAGLNRVLLATARRLSAAPADVAEALQQGKAELLSNGFEAVDYLALCDASDLQRLTTLDRPARLLAAVHLGTVRLIDNIAVLPV
jgi:pantoate--beta-alanine ligase